MKKETSYQKLKRELKESQDKYNSLFNDFFAYHNGVVSIKVKYAVVFRMHEQFERSIWSGSTTISNLNTDNILNGIK